MLVDDPSDTFQTCVKKMRLDMPILNDDFVGSDQEGDDVIRQGDDLPPQVYIAHYENMSMQYIEFSEAVKFEDFQ